MISTSVATYWVVFARLVPRTSKDRNSELFKNLKLPVGPSEEMRQKNWNLEYLRNPEK